MISKSKAQDKHIAHELNQMPEGQQTSYTHH